MPGEVVYAGATDFKCIGRSQVKDEVRAHTPGWPRRSAPTAPTDESRGCSQEGQKYPNLYTPTRIKTLIGVRKAARKLLPLNPHRSDCR